MKAKSSLKAGALTLYGADWCGWTKKQKAYLDGKGIPYTYVNCESSQCPAFVEAYPTMDNNGSILLGYKEI